MASSAAGCSSMRSAIRAAGSRARSSRYTIASAVGRRHRQLAALGVGPAAGAEERRALERRRRVGRLQHRALGVVGDDDHGVAVEEPLEAAGRLDQQPEAVVGALDRSEHVAGGPVLGGVGLVQVEEQEVEPVTRHEPAADGAAVAVDAAAEVVRARR